MNFCVLATGRAPARSCGWGSAADADATHMPVPRGRVPSNGMYLWLLVWLWFVFVWLFFFTKINAHFAVCEAPASQGIPRDHCGYWYPAKNPKSLFGHVGSGAVGTLPWLWGHKVFSGCLLQELLSPTLSSRLHVPWLGTPSLAAPLGSSPAVTSRAGCPDPGPSAGLPSRFGAGGRRCGLQRAHGSVKKERKTKVGFFSCFSHGFLRLLLKWQRLSPGFSSMFLWKGRGTW